MARFLTYEDIMRALNPSGQWQWFVLVQTLVIQCLVATLYYEQNYVIAAPMHYVCIDDDGNSSWPDATSTRDECFRQDGVTPCTRWNYTSAYYKSTMVSEFDLVCGNAVLVPLFKSFSLVGFFFGLALWGVIADRYGRRPVAAIGVVANLIFCWTIAYAPTYLVTLVGRLFTGVMASGYYKSLIVLNFEVTTEARRNLVGVLFAATYPVAGLATAFVGYTIGEWRAIYLWTTAAAMLALPLCLLLPESPRWLITNERYSRALRILRFALRVNRREPPKSADLSALHDAHVQDQLAADESRVSWKALAAVVKDSEIRTRTLVMGAQWFSTGLTFYGIMWYATDHLPGSPFTKLALTCCARLLCAPFVAYAMQRFGKRRFMLSIWLSGGVAVGGLAVLPKMAPVVLTMTLTVVAILIFDASYTAIYTFTAELFPTLLRQSGMSLCSMFSRIGAASAPFVVDMLAPRWHQLPALIFVGACTLAALCLLAVPETNLCPLPDTISDTRANNATQLSCADDDAAEADDEERSMLNRSTKQSG